MRHSPTDLVNRAPGGPRTSIVVAMTSLPRLVTALGLGLGLAGALSGCSTTIDNEKMSDELTRFYEKNDPGSDVTSVDCPDSPDAKKGETFVCDFDLKTGESGQFTVTVKNSDGDVSFELTKNARAIIDVSKAEGLIADDVTERGGTATSVECPDDFPGTLDEEVECQVQLDDGSSATAVVSVTDVEGNLELVRYE